jgi:Gram-negative bacterial TonB protein C-terminal
MRKLLLVASAAALTVSLIIAQAPPQGGGGGRGGGKGKGGPPAPPPPPPPAGLECFDTLATPEFPRAALQQKVDGTVWVNFEVTPQGAVDKMETQVTSAYADGPKLLTPPAEAAVKAAKIKSDCNGKKVLVVFRYELHGEPVANPQVTSRREPSYIVWIESQPMTRAAAGAGKAAKQ